MERNKKRKTGKVCKRGGPREPRIEEGGSGGRFHTSSQSSCPEEEEEEPEPPETALLSPALGARTRSASYPARQPLQPSPSADMASGATPTAVKVRLAVLAAEVSPAQCSLACPGRPRLGAERPACAPTPRRDESKTPHPGRFAQGRGAGGEGTLANVPFTFGLCCIRTARGVGNVPLLRGAVDRRCAGTWSSTSSRGTHPAVCLPLVRPAQGDLRDSCFRSDSVH